jgi:hypothetical protein
MFVPEKNRFSRRYVFHAPGKCSSVGAELNDERGLIKVVDMSRVTIMSSEPRHPLALKVARVSSSLTLAQPTFAILRWTRNCRAERVEFQWSFGGVSVGDPDCDERQPYHSVDLFKLDSQSQACPDLVRTSQRGIVVKEDQVCG